MARTSRDVVVVGGGIVGCFCAYYLARAGVGVVLVERDAIAGATSGSCMGHLMVVPKPHALYELTHKSVLLWHELVGELEDFEYNPTGTLWLATCDEDMELLVDLRDTLGAYGDSGRLLDRTELREIEPGLAPDLPGALHYSTDAVVMPMLAAGAALRAAVRLGARVMTHTAVTGLRRGSGGAIEAVVTDRGEVACDSVVNAAGVWAPGLGEDLGLPPVPIHPRRGELAITMPRECPVRHQLLEVSYLRTTESVAAGPESAGSDPGGQALNVQPQSHGTCLIGSTRQFAGFGRTVDRDLLARSLQRAVRFVPDLAGARLTRTWAGLRPFTPDGLPIVGPVPELPGLHMAAGHEGLGITLAPITGEMVADAITGQPTSLPLAPLSLGRFGSATGTAHG